MSSIGVTISSIVMSLYVYNGCRDLLFYVFIVYMLVLAAIVILVAPRVKETIPWVILSIIVMYMTSIG